MSRALRYGLLALTCFPIACEGGGQVGGTLSVRVANSRQFGSVSACPGEPRLEVPADWSCVGIQVADALGDPVSIAVPGVTEMETSEPVLVTLGANNDFQIDLRDATGPFQVRATLYDQSGNAVADGVADGVRFDRDTVVAAYGLNQANCLIDDVGAFAPSPRAFHEAIRLPNGDVMIVGGVEGATAPLREGSEPTGFALRRSIETFRPGDHTWVQAPVPGGDPSALADLGRVFFGMYLEQTAPVDGRFAIRVVGGFTADAVAAVGLDPEQLQSSSGAPIVPLPGASTADDVRLFYDPRERSVEVVPLGPSEVAGASVVGDEIEGRRLVVGGVTDAGVGATSTALPSAQYSGQRWLLEGLQPRQAAAGSDVGPRFGMSASATEDGWVVFGGNRTTDRTRIAEEAAALVRADGSVEPLRLTFPGDATIMPDEHVPGFHLAAVVDGELLAAGGIRVTCDCSATEFPFDTTLAQPSIVTLLTQPGTLEARAIGGSYTPTVFQSATYLATGGIAGGGGVVQDDVGRWLLTGGAGPRLSSSSQAAVVARDGGGALAAASFVPDGLLIGRFGHTAVALDDRRVLVVGGVTQGTALECGGMMPCYVAIAGAEVLTYGYSATDPPSVNPEACRGESGG